MAYDIGINHRATSGYVTDGANETYCLDEVTDPYPTTRGGFTFGWESGGISAVNRDSGIDRRLAGTSARTNNGSQAVFRIDLPETGSAEIHIALGDAGFGQGYQYALIEDDATTVATIDKSAGTSAAEWYDASGTLRTSATDWANNEASISHTFTSTILRVTIGAPTSQSDASTLAHVRVVGVAGNTGAGGSMPTHQHVHNPTRNVTVFMRERFRRAGELFVPDRRLVPVGVSL